LKPLTREEKIAKIKSLSKPSGNDEKWKKIAKWNRDHADALLDYATIAMRIADAIKEKNMKQKDLAQLLDVTPQALTRIMKGRQNLTLQSIRKIENILEIKLVTIHEPKSKIKLLTFRKECVSTQGKHVSDYTQSISVFSGKIIPITNFNIPNSSNNYLQIEG